MNTPEDRFQIDVRRDLERVDEAMSEVIRSTELTEEFVRDPNGVLSRLGMHPETTPEIHDRVNRIFYAVLTNRELIDFLVEEFGSFEVPEQLAEENRRVHQEGLERGEVRNLVEFDLAAADHFFRREDALKRVYQLTLRDLNRQELLQERYSDEEIDEYVERLAEAILARRPISEIPELERWDDNYGVGTGYGVGEVEVGPVATLGAIVEVGLFTTVWVSVEGDSIMVRAADRMIRGNPGEVRMIATAASLFRLAGEVMVHAEEFRR
jgi:hypothetical protein